jgi:hypothetical protein
MLPSSLSTFGVSVAANFAMPVPHSRPAAIKRPLTM